LKIVFLSILLLLNLSAKSLEELASGVLMVGFDGSTAPKFLKKYKVAGVILFSKNIKNKTQLKKLTRDIKKFQPSILIAIDEEGGKVQRLKKFAKFKSAKDVAKSGKKFAKLEYERMAKLLNELGINLNLAPDVDLEYKNNPIIAKYKRSYGKNPTKVIEYAGIFTSAMRRYKILTTLKHFPGHGSSRSDSHKGFTDVSQSWQKRELIPFKKVKSPLIMTAHIFNSNLDPTYPATLSYKINTQLLRKKLGFDGVLISDDMQMGAISKNYDFKEALKLAISSGVDIVLIGNFLDKPIEVKKIVDTIVELVKSGEIKRERLEEANRRIKRVLLKYQKTKKR